MPKYVDGYVLPVPTKNLEAYRAMAQKGAKLWREHGALEYRECVCEDTAVHGGMSFPQGVGIKEGETVIFAWITFRSRAHRDEVNAAVFQDPRMSEGCDINNLPFDSARMLHSGFDVIVEG